MSVCEREEALRGMRACIRRLDAWFGSSTDQKMSVLFLMVVSAVMPTSDFPAPHGSTMMPLRARPFPNILLSDFSW